MLFGKYDPEKMQELMEKFGIKSEKIDADEVIIKLKNKKMSIVLKKPDILLTYVMDRKVYQISAAPKKKKA
ncbi:MAG: hypothetical protein HZB65_03215 [Candidatus Aenigmarchaeota archaeon]|nr:hypothetical protein [Candidatus Aenigmarchaeota archaeon]